MGNSVLRLLLAAWSVLVPDAPAFLSGRRMGVDLSILAYKALSNLDMCTALYAGDQRFFVSKIKQWVTRVMLWGAFPVIVFDSVRDPVFAPKLAEQQRRRADVAAASAALAAGGLSPEEKEKLIRVVTRPSPDLMHAVALELVKMGVPYVLTRGCPSGARGASASRRLQHGRPGLRPKTPTVVKEKDFFLFSRPRAPSWGPKSCTGRNTHRWRPRGHPSG